jgi:hypothetical protein
VSGVRQRNACIGYGTTCSGISTVGSLAYNSDIPAVTITDYEDDGVVAATTTSTVPSTGSPTGNIRISNIDYYLAENNGELPAWFVHNKWHQFIYAAYSDGWKPGAAGACVAGTDCLQLQSITYATTQTDRHSAVMSVGRELDSSISALNQNRIAGALTNYLEGENATSGNEVFQKGLTTTTYNDVVSTVCPDTDVRTLGNAVCP